MNCNTVKNGFPCLFMSPARGCLYGTGCCETIVDKCKGCDRVIEYEGKEYCFTYPSPPSRWKNIGNCPLCSTTKKDIKAEKFLNPLKESKKKFKKKKG